ncbi:MAG: hypothetical protein RMH97_05495 [Verrucomicrobiales bacterium]|nr:hypothetical protein [Verrucomicrobiales bacterium]
MVVVSVAALVKAQAAGEWVIGRFHVFTNVATIATPVAALVKAQPSW